MQAPRRLAQLKKNFTALKWPATAHVIRRVLLLGDCLTAQRRQSQPPAAPGFNKTRRTSPLSSCLGSCDYEASSSAHDRVGINLAKEETKTTGGIVCCQVPPPKPNW